MSPLSQLTTEPIAVIPQIEITSVVSLRSIWQKFTYTFTAADAYKYITIGNFRDDFNTSYTATGILGAYYFIDEITIAPLVQNFSPIFGADTTLCEGKKLTLDASISNARYFWQDNSTDPLFTVAQKGKYWVRVTNACGIVNADTILVDYKALPVVNLGNDTVVCSGKKLTLDAGNAGAGFFWQDNSIAQLYPVSGPGTYSVTVTNRCGSASDAIKVDYNALPVVNLGNDTVVCSGKKLTLDAGNAGAGFFWQDNSIAQLYPVSGPGTYSVMVTNSCGSASDAIKVDYNALPVVNLGNDTVVCSGKKLTLDAGNAGAGFFWQDNSIAQLYPVSGPGIYSVTVTNSCGSASDAIKVDYNALPVVNLGNDTVLCSGKKITLDAGNAGAGFFWQDNSIAQLYPVSGPGIYSVTVTNSCGSASDAIKVDYKTLPVVNLGNDTVVCADIKLTLDAGNAGAGFFWQDNSIAQLYPVSKPGTYSVAVTNSCGAAIDSITVSRSFLPDVELGPDITLCQGQKIRLNAASPNAAFRWQDNSDSSFLMVTVQGKYSVTVTNSCGFAADTVFIGYQNCLCSLYVPTAFTPNNDPLNSRFSPLALPATPCRFIVYRFTVFNRWGEKVFETNKPGASWDGTFKGLESQPGVYPYLITYQFENAAVKTKQGQVSLIR
jgi:gliding motility-associated-like protein